MINQLIWLDEHNGEVIGFGEKLETHIKGIYHRAFSIYIYDYSTSKVLIQRRARSKYHSGGLLSNSCCSHLYRGETWQAAINRCILTELGVLLPKKTTLIEYAGVFTYRSMVGELIEYEEDNVFVIYPSPSVLEEIQPQHCEVEEVLYLSLNEIEIGINGSPMQFTAWFKESYELAKKVILGDNQMRLFNFGLL